MTLHIFNTLTRRKQSFVPQDPSRVTMYVCGPTVHDRVHVGNARPVVVFDVLYRLLTWHFDTVVYARNITDIDDRILHAARERHQPFLELARHFETCFLDDMAALNALAPTLIPRATAHIEAMIGMIERLIERGHAYIAEQHVLFHVPGAPDHGELSGIDRAGMLEGARVEVAPYKRDPADFVLWKPSTEDQPGRSSPWGRGRPGWHIECSAMVDANLGTTIDIHGGGRDLIFPHHENEIAQSRGVHDGAPLANYWVHNGMVTVGGEKMAKSRGNFTTVESLLARYPGEVIRYALLGGHYRQPLDISDNTSTAAWKSLDRLYRGIRHALDDDTTSECAPAGTECDAQVMTALDDDLNTPKALARLHEMVRELNQLGKPMNAETRSRRRALAKHLLASGRFLGLLTSDATAWFQARDGDAGARFCEEDISTLVALREQARSARDYRRADALRDQLAEMDVELEDRPDGSTFWQITATEMGSSSTSGTTTR